MAHPAGMRLQVTAVGGGMDAARGVLEAKRWRGANRPSNLSVTAPSDRRAGYDRLRPGEDAMEPLRNANGKVDRFS